MAVLCCSKIFFSAVLILVVECQNSRMSNSYLAAILDRVKNIEIILSQNAHQLPPSQETSSMMFSTPETQRNANVNVNKNVNLEQRSLTRDNGMGDDVVDIKLLSRREIENSMKNKLSGVQSEDQDNMLPETYRKNSNLNTNKNTNVNRNLNSIEDQSSDQIKTRINLSNEGDADDELVPKTRRSFLDDSDSSSEESR